LNFWHLKKRLNLCSKFFFKLHIFNYNTYGFVNSKCKLVLVLDSSMFFQTIIISLYFNKSNSNNCWCQVFPKPQKTIRFHERTINFVLSFYFTFYFFYYYCWVGVEGMLFKFWPPLIICLLYTWSNLWCRFGPKSKIVENIFLVYIDCHKPSILGTNLNLFKH
jgi:hypothetical protein